MVAGAEFRSTLSNPSDWLIESLGGSSVTTSGERVTVSKALGMIAVFAAVSKISGTVGSLPCKVFRELEGGKVEARDHRAWRLLHDKPNPLMSSQRFWSTLTGNVLLWGNGFMQKGRNDVGLVDTLWLLDPARVTIEYSEIGHTKRYTYQRQTGEKVRIREDDMVHVMDYSLDGIVGESRIGRCRDALGKSLARDRFEGNFYGRGLTVKGVIEHPGKLGVDGPKRLRESWTAVYGGTSGHQVAVLEEGAQFKSVQAPLADLQFVESAQLSVAEIAILFNLNPVQLGAAIGQGSLVYQTVEGNDVQYAKHTIYPIVQNFAKTLEQDTGIFPFASWWPEFELKALMAGDSRSRADYYKTMDEIGAIFADEVRTLEGLPPDDRTDEPDPPSPIIDPADVLPITNGKVEVPA
jgi:HK97 family phage portal protein